ncbi:MAG: right-handed parallel beta-helix repeat-containing protein, partial [Desulfobacteraceae bacterium]
MLKKIRIGILFYTVFLFLIGNAYAAGGDMFQSRMAQGQSANGLITRSQPPNGMMQQGQPDNGVRPTDMDNETAGETADVSTEEAAEETTGEAAEETTEEAAEETTEEAADETTDGEMPEDGEMPSGMDTASAVEKSGVYEQDGGSVTQSDKTYSATETDESAVYVYGGGDYILIDSILEKTGDTSSDDSSNFYGSNAIVLVEGQSTMTLIGSTLYSDANGANGVFAYEEGSAVYVSGCDIETHGNSSRGVDATYGGIVQVSDTVISTEGNHSAAIASDRYEDKDPPTMIADNVTGQTAGEGSPGIYCTGTFTVSNSNLTATGSEAAAIEGMNSITLTDSTIEGAVKWGVIIYQSTSGDSSEGMGTFDMAGGALTSKSSGPTFMVCNTE